MSNRLAALHLRARPGNEGLVARDRWQWAVLSVVLIGATMSALDVSIVNIALPTIRREFGVRLSLVEWVSIAYMLVLAIGLPIVGRLADIYGRSLLYNLGFAIFVVGSAACGLAPSAVFLILARGLQAIGAALLQANSVALITVVFRKRDLGQALGVQAAIQATAMALGPFVGAMLIAAIGWRIIFYVNMPIGIAGMVLAHFVLPRHRPVGRRDKIDVAGIFLFTLGLLGVSLAVNAAQSTGWSSPIIVTELVVGIVCFVLFVHTELRVESPTIDIRQFRSYTLVAGNSSAFLAYYGLFTALFLLPFYFEDVLNYSTAWSGVMLMPVPAAMAIIAPFAGRAVQRFGARMLTLVGSAMLAAGSAVLILAPSEPAPLFLVVAMLLLGAGLGIFTPANNRATMAATPRDKLGVMGGLLNMMRSLGLIFGIDISGMVFMRVAAGHVAMAAHLHPVALGDLGAPAFMHGFHVVMATLAGVALLTVVFSFFRDEERGIQGAAGETAHAEVEL